jgi:hypothetical protein
MILKYMFQGLIIQLIISSTDAPYRENGGTNDVHTNTLLLNQLKCFNELSKKVK